MNTGEEDLLSGLNGRLRPRKSTLPSPQIKTVKKYDGKVLHDKSKKHIGPAKAALICQDDQPANFDSTQALNFLCPYCDKKFLSKLTVFKHARRMHFSTSKQNSFIGCLFCNHTESDPNDIIRHMVDSHPNQYFACYECHTRFSSTSQLAEHKLNICETQKPYRSKLRPKSSDTRNKSSFNGKSDISSKDREYATEPNYNGIVISCELKPSQVHDTADIEDNITTNLILPPSKNIANNNHLEKNAVIVLDDIQWKKRMPHNFTFHNTDADQILSRLGVIHRTPRSGESNRKDWFKNIEESTQNIDKCYDTDFFARVASNVQENLTQFLDGTFNFNPDVDNIIKTRKAKDNAVSTTADGFPILLKCEQYSRNVFEGYLPRVMTSKYKYKWENLDNNKTLVDSNELKRDTHSNNCIISLVASLDIWTQLCMRRKFEDKFCHVQVEKKVERQNRIDKELKEILESRELPTVPSQIVKYTNKSLSNEVVDFEFPAHLGLTPLEPQYPIKPAILSGEWVRPRCYVCCACGAQTRDARTLSSHISTEHPNAQVQHYEVVGDSLLNADIIKHLYIPPSQLNNRTRPLRGFRECTKCKIPSSLEELHQHMLDCAGDVPTVRRKCRYRPFGVRKRRPRLPDNTIRKKIRKDIRNRQRQKGYIRSRARPRIKTEVGDAETIRKMLADLPAKRHRVMVNPLNSILRPRRKFELQRNKLLIKRRPSDDPKNRIIRKLRNKDVCNSKTIGETTHKKLTSIENNVNKVLRAKMKHMTSKTSGQNESFQKSTMFKRAKRSINIGMQHHERGIVSDENLNENLFYELPPDGLPQKIDVNGGAQKVREHSGGHKETNTSSNDSNPKDGGYDPRGRGCSPGDGGYNQPNGDRSDNNNARSGEGRENGDKKPVQNIPLKHSIARLTANSETHDKAVQFHHLFLVQQECNNITEHAPTGQRDLFENEAVVTKLDKPPLHYPKGSFDSYSLQKIKFNKPRKGLNDCIAMLKNKLVDPPTRSMVDQVSVQCGDDEPIDPIQCVPKTIIESGINMTPAQIFYRPILPQNPMLVNNVNIPNFPLYSYPTNRKSETTTRAERHKFRQKRLSQNGDKPLSKEKRNECVIKRKSTRLKSIARAQIELQHDLMRLPPQIEIIPQPFPNVPNTKSTRVRSFNQYENNESDMLNQQMLHYVLNKNRRPSVDTKTQNKRSQKKSTVVQPVTTISFDSQYQVNWPERQFIAHKSFESNPKTHQTNQIQDVIPESTPDKPYEAKAQYKPHVLSNDTYVKTNNNMSPKISPTHSIDTPALTPLDLSDKYVSVNQAEIISQVDDTPSTIYDSYGTLDLSCKRPKYLKATNDSTLSDIIVDLSFKPTTQIIPESTDNNIYNSSEEYISNTATDLSTSAREIDCLPTDLSMKAIDVGSSIENFDYEVEDLSGYKDVENEHALSYSDVIDIDKDIPTDLSRKTEKISLDILETPVNLKINENMIKENLNKNNELPADLSTKSDIDYNIYSTVLEATANRPSETIQDTNITNSSTSPIADVPQDYVLKPVYETFTELSQCQIKDMTQSKQLCNIISENGVSDLYLSNEPCVVQVSEQIEYEPILNSANVTWQQAYNHSGHHVSSQDRLPYECALEPHNVTVSPIIGSISVYNLSNPIQTKSTSKFESTTPVYTLPNTCISITKIETSNSNNLTNSLLSVPGTTITNTTSVYTLAGTSVSAPTNYGMVPQPINDIRCLSGNSSLLQSVSPSCETTRAINQYNLQTNVSYDLKPDNKDPVSSVVADLDPETASKVAKLPKEIVDILGTMPIDHRKQLINILPHYVSVSESGSNPLTYTNNIVSNVDISHEPLPDYTNTKKYPYLQVQTADSTSGPKNHVNINIEDDFRNNISHHQSHMDINLIPLPPLPPPPTIYGTIHDGPIEFLNNEQTIIYNDEVTRDSDCNDVKIIDLTEDDNMDVPKELDKDNADIMTAVTESELTNRVIPKGNKQKINDQTASLRAVRIKTPSERQKSISNANNALFKNPTDSTKQNMDVGDLIDLNNLAIKESSANITVSADNNSTKISYVANESDNKTLTDEHFENISIPLTNSIVVEATPQREGNCSDLDSTAIVEKDIICTQQNNIQVDLNMTNTDIESTAPSENKVVNDMLSRSEDNIKNNDLQITTSNDINSSILMPTEKHNFVTPNEHVQSINNACDNKKDVSGEDDSEDDILLAVIVKQRREKQMAEKLEDKAANDDPVNVNKTSQNVMNNPTSSNKNHVRKNVLSKANTRKAHRVRNSKNKNISRKLKYNNDVPNILLEKVQKSAEKPDTNANENITEVVKVARPHSKKSLKVTKSATAKSSTKTTSSRSSTPQSIEKVDMGVQYECVSKGTNNEDILGNNIELYDINHSATQDIIKTAIHQDDINKIIGKDNNRINDQDTVSNRTHAIKSKLVMLNSSNDKTQNINENIEINSEIEKAVQTEASKIHEYTCELSNPENVHESAILEENSETISNKDENYTKYSTNIHTKDTEFANKDGLSSDVEDRTQSPLRRSRRDKSMSTENNIRIDDGNNAYNTDLSMEHRTHLTKKQRIFSKLLLDGENRSNNSVGSTPDNENEIQQDCIDNNKTDNNDISQNLNSLEFSPPDNKHINKSKKRRSSTLSRRKIKKKKRAEVMNASNSNDPQVIKTSVSESCSVVDPMTSNNNISVDDNTLISFKGINNDDQINSTTIRLDLIPESTVERNSTVTESTLKVCLSLTGVQCSVNCEKLSITTEKQKLVLPTTSSILALDSKPKKNKTKHKKIPGTSSYYHQNDNLEEEVVLQQEIRIFPNVEPRTTCYSRSVAIKRTRSKSVVVKSTNNDLIYDPYDINMDDMITNSETLDKKRLKPDESKSSNQAIQSSQLQSHLIPSELKETETEPSQIGKKMKKSVEIPDRFRRGVHFKNDSGDSDDSSKSDVPLTKYVKHRVKRTKKSHDSVSDKEVHDINLGGISSSDKDVLGCRNSRSALVPYNNNEASTSRNETEVRLKSEQFMESFGFFSERQPRKSNLLAAKKISETFHIIANESDDAYVGYRERAIKKAFQNAGKKTKAGESSKQPGSVIARKLNKRKSKKKKIRAQLPDIHDLYGGCTIDFRRLDNYLRHGFNLFHITTISDRLQIRIGPLFEEPNYLNVYKQHLEKLQIIIDKLAVKEKFSKKIVFPTVTDILIEVNRVVRQQLISQRVLTRDEALFLHCCELLKESHISDADSYMLDSSYSCPQATLTGLALIEKQIDEDQGDCDDDEVDPQTFKSNYICAQATLNELVLIEKQIILDKSDSRSDGDVDSITARNIFESEEVRNLENDLISNLKQAAIANKAHNSNYLLYRNTTDDVEMNSNIAPSQTISDYNNIAQTSENFDNCNEPSTSKMKKPEVKRMMYPDIIENINMYEDKFDKIKRKCRSQAAAAKQIQSVAEPSTSHKSRKKSEKKRVKKSLKKKHQGTQVPTKGALKGFDILKVFVPQSKANRSVHSHERSKKKKKKNGSKKKRDKKHSESNNKHEIDHRTKDTNAASKNIDVYEFMDNEDAELFEFRPSTLMERFKSLSNKAGPSTSKVHSITNFADYSSASISDGDDFVYMSDDYVGSDDDTDNSVPCEPGSNRVAMELKKAATSFKRKEHIDKNAAGKSFKHNSHKTEKKCVKHKEDSKGKSNLDQLFDSLLDKKPESAANNSIPSKVTDPSSEYVSEYATAFQNTPQNNNEPSKNSPKKYDEKSPKRHDSSSKKYKDYYNYIPTSKKREKVSKHDYSTDPKKYSYKSQHQKEFSPKSFYNTAQCNNDKLGSYDHISSKYKESLLKKDNLLTKRRRDSNEKSKIDSSLKIGDDVGNSCDYVAELCDQASNDEAGVARQRARRKCAVGKQKVLAEIWSSESEPDGAPPPPDSAESEKSDVGRKKKIKKREKHHSNGRRGTIRSVTFKKQNDSNRNSSSGDRLNYIDDNKNPHGSGVTWMDHYKNRHEEPSGSGLRSYRTYTSEPTTSHSAAFSSKTRPRSSSYYWSSDQDDDQEEHLQQHGWIVGDSHKKLVTMLAHAKGRKRNNDDKHHLVE